MIKSMKRMICVVLILVTFFCGMCSCDAKQGEKKITPMHTDVLKIGKADCIVINTGNKIVMIDTGEADDLSEICDYMRKNEYTQIDTLILTHYDKDHIGGAAGIMSYFPVGEVIENRTKSGTTEYIAYHGVIAGKSIPVMQLSENYTFTYDSCEFTVYVPEKQKYEAKNANNSSLIVSVKCGENSFLFCGDAMELRLEEFMASNAERYDFVKLPYHGNYIENYEAFLKRICPEYAVITSSKKNPASAETLSLLSALEIETYQTKSGTLRVQTNGKTIVLAQDSND